MPTTPEGPRDLSTFRLYDAALQRPEAEREAFLREAAGDDPALREAVLRLLAEPLPDTTRPAADAITTSSPEPRVHATATGELVQRLECAPKFDADRYQLEGEVARGGMGVILRIHDRHLNRRLAMKLLIERADARDEAARKLAHQLLGRFLEEAQVTSQLDHPGVVPVHELGLDQNGKVYFTMRLVKGRTAGEVFRDAHHGERDWTSTRALEVILKVCDTMAYAHDKGVLHRDLKPGNVMVGRFGEVYVMDWGLAKVLGQEDRRDLRIRPEPVSSASHVDSVRKRDAEHDDNSSVVSMDGQKLGTPSYMPPEQGRSEAVDRRADVYAIGAMLYELLTGRAPYTTPGVHKPAYRILDDLVAGPPRRIEELQKGVPAELVAIVDKAMARDREQRYADTPALAADLRAYLGQRVVGAYRTGALVELELWVRRNKPLAASLLVAVLILVAGIAGTTAYAGEASRQAMENGRLANEKTALAQEKTELAAAETRAKEEALSRKREFDQLAVKVRYERVLAAETRLYPAWPTQIPAMEDWLHRVDELLAGRGALDRTIEELRERALPRTPAQIEHDRRTHPKFAQWQRLVQQVASLEQAQAVRTGAPDLMPPQPTAAEQALTPKEINALVWPLVTPDDSDRTYGQEARALMLAKLAWKKAAALPDAERATYGVALAWALFATGKDAEAIAHSTATVAIASVGERAKYEEQLAKLQARIEAAKGSTGTKMLADLRTLTSALEAEVSTRQTYQFLAADEARRFLHETLVEVRQSLDALESGPRRAVEQRLHWARKIGTLTKTHPRAHTTWAQAREAIAKADDVVASKLYAGQGIELRDEDVLGLVPIGMNPATRLWEFYDLCSARPSRNQRDAKEAAGRLGRAVVSRKP